MLYRVEFYEHVYYVEAHDHEDAEEKAKGTFIAERHHVDSRLISDGPVIR